MIRKKGNIWVALVGLGKCAFASQGCCHSDGYPKEVRPEAFKTTTQPIRSVQATDDCTPSIIQ